MFVCVDLAFVIKALQDAAHDALVTIVRCRRPFIVFNIEFLPRIDKFLGDAFNEFGWGNARFRGGLLHFLPMLINAGEKKYLFAFQPMIPRDHIGQDFFVGMTDVRRRIRVIDGRGDEERLRHFAKLPDESL